MKTAISIACSIYKIPSFYKYLIVLLQSIREKGNINIPIVVWSQGFSEKQKSDLSKIYEDIEVREVDTEKYVKYNKLSAGWFCLEAYSMKEYDKVLLIDTDMVCLGDLNGLINYNCDLGMCREGSGLFNGGLQLIGRPFLQNGAYYKLLSAKQDEISIGGKRDKWSKDQKLLNYFYKDQITALPEKFNTLVSRGHLSNIVLLHYIYKPLYDVGRNQLQNINPKYIEIWEDYYKKAVRTIES